MTSVIICIHRMTTTKINRSATMTTEIRIEKLSDGFAVYFPYELKDGFKALFKTAKWMPYDKCWKTGVRSLKKLEQWKKAVEENNVLDLIEEKDAAELTVKEYEKLQAQLSNLKSNIASVKEKINSERDYQALIAKSKQELDENRAKLDDVEKALAIEAEKTRQEKHALETMLDKIIDFNKIYNAKDTLARYHKQVGATAREQFAAAQEEILEEIHKLKKAGYRSKGLLQLYYANFNRPDRDHIYLINEKSILDISKVEDDDE